MQIGGTRDPPRGWRMAYHLSNSGLYLQWQELHGRSGGMSWGRQTIFVLKSVDSFSKSLSPCRFLGVVL